MNLSSYVLEQALRQLDLPAESIRQFRIASSLSDVEGRGFPKELFQLSAPMVVRGLLNYATIQMNRDWLYPFWAERQLDPESESYVPRSQNPLFLNVTHRNWTGIGTPTGKHEAIVDPRGLLTPIPRTWSVDCWVVTDDGCLFPGRAANVHQELVHGLPLVKTTCETRGVRLVTEHFGASTSHALDVTFSRATLFNDTPLHLDAWLVIAVRPFDPEGVSPVEAIEIRNERNIIVNGATGLVLGENPDWSGCSAYASGDLAYRIAGMKLSPLEPALPQKVHCPRGLAHAVAVYHCSLPADGSRSIPFSVALESEKAARNLATRKTWRVSYERRLLKETRRWEDELAAGADVALPEGRLQRIFDASRLALLQFHDGDFISPGPFLYHHFWYRDAALMVRALDILGFHRRSRQVIDAFPRRQMADGFFKGPDGEWDSNGAALWTIRQHYHLQPSRSWLSHWYPAASRAARWILRKRRQSSNGLLPPSLSAEHLGTVDQYYWDSFWGLAGIEATREFAQILDKKSDIRLFEKEYDSFRTDLLKSIESSCARLGSPWISATPTRGFDESAIGSISSLYPLRLFEQEIEPPLKTVQELVRRYVKPRGFLHPFIHSGYNPYLTMQLAHSLLLRGLVTDAWKVARTILDTMTEPYSLPEAIHPRTGGGVMGDGHHGWAAAEIILFLRDCLVLEQDGKLTLLEGLLPMYHGEKSFHARKLPTSFGPIDLVFTTESGHRGMLEIEIRGAGQRKPDVIEIVLPFETTRERTLDPHQIQERSVGDGITRLRCSPDMRRLFFER